MMTGHLVGWTSTPGLRVRVGDCRIIYRVNDDVLLVVVVTLGHRREVYERCPGLAGFRFANWDGIAWASPAQVAA
ncbi:MAG: hypothetical protein DLM66_14805 [Candidatus Dormiibacter spiritus]|nr:MAG: hypothetical protein DLM66_14805 [Candidatus Dormibacteraeota bacterium]